VDVYRKGAEQMEELRTVRVARESFEFEFDCRRGRERTCRVSILKTLLLQPFVHRRTSKAFTRLDKVVIIRRMWSRDSCVLAIRVILRVRAIKFNHRELGVTIA
jgi:hypothetical protein